MLWCAYVQDVTNQFFVESRSRGGEGPPRSWVNVMDVCCGGRPVPGYGMVNHQLVDELAKSVPMQWCGSL